MGAAAVGILAGLTAASAQQSVEHQINRHPLLIFVAEGPPNSCGPGCSRWIAAEGAFDKGSADRLAKVIDEHTKLPIYLHSQGGFMEEALLVGTRLRKLRMKAGVGRTAIQNCVGVATSKDCRRLLESGTRTPAQLRPAEGVCGSACVYAFIGASSRTVDPNARITVHSTTVNRLTEKGYVAVDLDKMSTAERGFRDWADQKLSRHTFEMGVDPSLVELAAKVHPRGTRLLSRAELERFGVISKPNGETPWIGRDKRPDAVAYTLSKNFDRRANPTDELLNTTFSLTCYERGRITMSIDRQRARGEYGHEPAIHIKSDDYELWTSTGTPKADTPLDYRVEIAPFETVLKALPRRSFEYSEIFEGPWAERSNSIKLSTEGLGVALKKMQSECERIHDPRGR